MMPRTPIAEEINPSTQLRYVQFQHETNAPMASVALCTLLCVFDRGAGGSLYL